MKKTPQKPLTKEEIEDRKEHYKKEFLLFNISVFLSALLFILTGFFGGFFSTLEEWNGQQSLERNIPLAFISLAFAGALFNLIFTITKIDKIEPKIKDLEFTSKKDCSEILQYLKVPDNKVFRDKVVSEGRLFTNWEMKLLKSNYEKKITEEDKKETCKQVYLSGILD